MIIHINVVLFGPFFESERSFIFLDLAFLQERASRSVADSASSCQIWHLELRIRALERLLSQISRSTNAQSVRKHLNVEYFVSRNYDSTFLLEHTRFVFLNLDFTTIIRGD